LLFNEITEIETDKAAFADKEIVNNKDGLTIKAFSQSIFLS